MSNEKMLEVLKDEGFVKRILEMATQNEVQHAFKEKGVEVSKEEIGLLGDIINKMKEKNSTNLSIEELDEIAGGGDTFSDRFAKGAKSPFVSGMQSAFAKDAGNSNKRDAAQIAGALTTTTALAGGVLAAGAAIGAIGMKVGPRIVKWAREPKGPKVSK